MIRRVCIEINNEKYNFTILKLLGEGAQSKVYKCKKDGDFTFCAIKVFSKKLVDDENNTMLRDLVNNEYVVHSQLRHENIVKLINFGKDENYYYFIFEYCEGGSISDAVLNTFNIRKFFLQIVSALIYLRRKNVLHLDLKPENILIKDGSVKICDFGLCIKLNKNSKISGIQRGTLNFMSPEMVKKENISFETDLWSAGVVLYNMQFKSLPFYYFNCRKGDFVPESERIITERMVQNNITKRELRIPQSNRDSMIFDLISRILTKNQKERICLEDIFDHPYFK